MQAINGKTTVLSGLLFLGLISPPLLAFCLFKQSLLEYLTFFNALGLGFCLTFIFFSATLLYVVILGGKAIRNDHERLYVALAVTALAAGIDLSYCYFFGLPLIDFLAAMIFLYAFFLFCFLFAKVREDAP